MICTTNKKSRQKFYPDIVIVYEHKAREYYNSCLIKAELEKRGYSVWLCHHSYYHTWWMRLFAKPKAVITLCALLTELRKDWTTLEQHTNFLRGVAPYVINLQSEQMFRNENCEYNVVFDKTYTDRIYYVCWGEWRKRQLLELGIEEEHTRVTGAVQLDLCHEKFYSIYKTKSEIGKLYELDEKKEWVLFISSFPYVTYTDKEFEWSVKVQNQYKQKINIDKLYTMKDAATHAYTTILEWIEKYLWENTEQIIIYRPHPGEKVTQRIEKIKKLFPDNFYCIREENIQQWIYVCDYIDTWVSTAVVESTFMNKVCNIIQPIDAPKDFQPVFMDGLEKINTYEKFANTHRKQGCVSEDERDRRLNDYYANDHMMAYEEICDWVEEILSKDIVTENNRKMSRICKYIFSKHYLLSVYAAFVLTFHIKLGKLIPMAKLREFEKRLSKDGDIYDDCAFSPSDKEKAQRIREIVRNIEVK